MNVFVLNAGRTGSVTFVRACAHIDNYSAGHESRIGVLGPERTAYPDNHIEADNRLSWFLGRLDREYGDSAMYVHLKRNVDDAARSHGRRVNGGIIRAYRTDVIWRVPRHVAPDLIGRDYVDTVTANIELFLRDKHKQMTIHIERAAEEFPIFWEWIGAEGDRRAALAEFEIAYNSTAEIRHNRRLLKRRSPRGMAAKLRRVAVNLPAFLRDV